MDVPKNWRKRKTRTYLTTGKKLRKHLRTDKPIELRISNKTTQVTPTKKSSTATETLKESTHESFATTEGLITSCNASTQICSRFDEFCLKLPASFQKLIANGTLNEFCSRSILETNNQLKDFEHLVHNLACGRIDPNNICWLLNIHLGRLTAVSSTTLMRWDPQIVDFFSIIYILFGASAINVLRGPMHFSELVMENTKKGNFDPRTAKINIPIPSVTTLRSMSTGFPKEIPPGLINHSLLIAEKASKEKKT